MAQRQVSGILLEGLHRLEYRGYDSAGLAVLDSEPCITRHRTLYAGGCGGASYDACATEAALINRQSDQATSTQQIGVGLLVGGSVLAVVGITVLAGLLTLPCLVLLGREVGGLRVGLLAAFFAGVGSWPNIISRLGLRR